MKSTITLILSLLLFGAHAQRTYVDVAPKGNKNYLPVEGGAIPMYPDTTAPLKDLIKRLDSDWRFIETGKMYWIGYTPDMFSIAARGDSAIDFLAQIASDTSLSHRYRFGAIYTLHLIGINRQIKGRFYEEFVNMKARKALLHALKYPDLRETVISLLCRAPRLSDIPPVIEILSKDSSECWGLNNFLTMLPVQLPLNQDIPDTFKNASVPIVYTPEMQRNIETQLGIIITAIYNLHSNSIVVDTELLNKDLWGPDHKGLVPYTYNGQFGKVNINIRDFLYEATGTGYDDVGNKFQYYTEGGAIFICTQATARKRLLAWWNNLRPAEKNEFENDSPVKTKLPFIRSLH